MDGQMLGGIKKMNEEESPTYLWFKLRANMEETPLSRN